MKKVRFVSVILAAIALGCGPRIIIKRGGPPPAWVDKQPRHPGMLCAVGYSGPTFYQQDCFKNAAENARSHLAESIAVTIKTITLDISDGSRGYFSRDTFVEGSESASEVVLTGAEVQAQWMDVEGVRGAPNGCYAWVCIDPSKPLDKLVNKLEEKKVPPKTIQKVRENAEAAFKELEKAEETHRQGNRASPSNQQQLPPAKGTPTEPNEKNEDSGGQNPETVPSASDKPQSDENGKGAVQPAVRKIILDPDSAVETTKETSGGEQK